MQTSSSSPIINQTAIQDCYIIEMDRHYDGRGFFQETYVDATYKNARSRWLQSNWSVSKEGVIRGIHVSPYPKLITCVSGKIFDVIIDLRKQSPTYMKKVYIWLSPNEASQVFVPADCGHGFYSAEENSMVVYQQGGRYTPSKEKRIKWNDNILAIEWPASEQYILSELDNNASGFIK